MQLAVMGGDGTSKNFRYNLATQKSCEMVRNISTDLLIQKTAFYNLAMLIQLCICIFSHFYNPSSYAKFFSTSEFNKHKLKNNISTYFNLQLF